MFARQWNSAWSPFVFSTEVAFQKDLERERERREKKESEKERKKEIERERDRQTGIE